MTNKARAGTATTHHHLVSDELNERMRMKFEEVKPKLRGWLHAGTAPLTLAAGIVLVALSPTTAGRVGAVVFMVTSVLLFTVSGIYHRGSWSPKVWAFLRRFDHANIFLLIAGSYTPFTLLLLEGSSRVVLLSVVWTVAVLGMLFRIFWTEAPRWLYVPIYIAMGWAAVFFINDFIDSISTAPAVLVATGGVLYTLGGIVYGLKKPNPLPGWFGFHEVFHSLTIAAFVTHYVAVSMVMYSLR